MWYLIVSIPDLCNLTYFTTPAADMLSPDMFQCLGWMSVKNRMNSNIPVMAYKALNNLTPSNLSD